MHHEVVGTISIGRAGTAEVTGYQQLDGLPAQQLNRFETGRPWMVAAATTLIGELLASGVTYPFETFDELFTWARIRVVTQDLQAAATEPQAPGETQGKSRWRAVYNLLEGQRAAFQQAGDAQQPFTLLNRQYTVRAVANARNHYYVDRNNQVITYSGRLTDGAARNIVRLLTVGPNHASYDPTIVDDGQVDEFTCAYLAEPTRWREEHVFDMLAVRGDSTTRPLTGNIGDILLPMASGTTWEPALGQLGGQVPRRIVRFADRIGLLAVIAQEIAAAADLNDFKTRVRGQYSLA